MAALGRSVAAGLACIGLVTCSPAVPLGVIAQPPACPRDAVAASGRCACVNDRVAVLGACVEPAVRDAYCGPASTPTADGTCAFRACAGREALDDGGQCIPASSLARSGPPCEPPAALVVTGGGHTACVPADAACPRGSFAGKTGCEAPPACPPGSLWTSTTCRPVVTQGPRGPVVDLGAWTSIALGSDGGPGSPELCRPLRAAPTAFDLARGDRLDVALAISLSVPDQDVSRVFASVEPRSPSGHPLPAAGAALARRSLQTLVEALRGLGGEASSSEVQVEVRCPVSSL
jgi:hypothetical protein